MNIGLILAGGMGKGAYQVGALKAIGKVFPLTDFPYISASSIGSINGYGFSSGRLDLIEDIWHRVNATEDSVTITELLKSDFMKRVLPEVAAQAPVAKVLKLPLLTIHIRERRLRYFDIAAEPDHNRRTDYLRAAVAVPLFGGRAIPIDGERYWDGAAVENMPTPGILPYDEDIDFYMVIYFDSTLKFFEEPALNKRTLRICFDDGTLAKNATCLTRESIDAMMEDGERKTARLLEYLVPNGKPDKAYILGKIEELSVLKNEERAKLISSSRALSALNGITKHLLTNP